MDRSRIASAAVAFAPVTSRTLPKIPRPIGGINFAPVFRIGHNQDLLSADRLSATTLDGARATDDDMSDVHRRAHGRPFELPVA